MGKRSPFWKHKSIGMWVIVFTNGFWSLFNNSSLIHYGENDSCTILNESCFFCWQSSVLLRGQRSAEVAWDVND